MSFQYGVPLEALVRKFSHQRFEPSGFTKNPEIRNAASITDYVFRWLAFQFVPGYREAHSSTRGQQELPMPDLVEELKKKVNRPVAELALADNDTDILDVTDTVAAKAPRILSRPTAKPGHDLLKMIVGQQDAPTCPNCGHVAVRNGACYKCLNCGESLGCS
jgi:ribonucleoside-diphosphate reductase alpha chain